MGERATIVNLYRYPVKGLSPEPLDRVTLEKGETFPFDRAFAIENGSADFDPAAPKHFPKIKFLMLMRDERLAKLKTRFDDATTTLHVALEGRERLAANLTTAEGRAALEGFMADYMKDELRGAPRLVFAPGFSHSDAPAKLVSIINMASVRALEEKIGRKVDPLRFRGNVYVEGLEPFEDHEWVGRRFRMGNAGFKGVHRTVRCAATNVDPATGARDMEIPAMLMRERGDADLGLYAHVSSPGSIKPGDTLVLED
ncbi:MOSC domain-containing protein [Parvibaculum sp.]|uniref:MOSC domain-containing protein n=1 Tax=Parvibaculum sp. TaxID=2024848 RepID=UPI001D2EA758|nr:MOSC domain-containing protein [Parvibaculum sp.]MBX3489288.1 MOSC domain-containing protein [Parvibaculum sp.]MCW5726756.1 MOSC domain-containing protein [Parvibaculum sp.]